MENYGTMEKKLTLWTKLRYYIENIRTSIYEEKNMLNYQILRNFDLQWKILWKYIKIIEVLNRLIALEL